MSKHHSKQSDVKLFIARMSEKLVHEYVCKFP
jgi:hypothetical protein